MSHIRAVDTNWKTNEDSVVSSLVVNYNTNITGEKSEPVLHPWYKLALFWFGALSAFTLFGFFFTAFIDSLVPTSFIYPSLFAYNISFLVIGFVAIGMLWICAMIFAYDLSYGTVSFNFRIHRFVFVITAMWVIIVAKSWVLQERFGAHALCDDGVCDVLAQSSFDSLRTISTAFIILVVLLYHDFWSALARPEKELYKFNGPQTAAVIDAARRLSSNGSANA